MTTIAFRRNNEFSRKSLIGFLNTSDRILVRSVYSYFTCRTFVIRSKYKKTDKYTVRKFHFVIYLCKMFEFEIKDERNLVFSIKKYSF